MAHIYKFKYLWKKSDGIIRTSYKDYNDQEKFERCNHGTVIKIVAGEFADDSMPLPV